MVSRHSKTSLQSWHRNDCMQFLRIEVYQDLNCYVEFHAMDGIAELP